MDPLDALRADLDAYIRGQRYQHNKASSAKTRSHRVMSPLQFPHASTIPPSVAAPAVSPAGPMFSPVATHEASGVAGDAGFFPSVFLKQASTPPHLSAFTTADFRAWLLDFLHC